MSRSDQGVASSLTARAIFTAAALAAVSVGLSVSFLTVCLGLTNCGCRQTPPPELPPQVATLIQEQKWDEAIPLLKHHLLVRPGDAAAHFYLGACYVGLRDPVLAVAEGELKIALTLFRQSGATGPVADMTAKDFELRCYLEIANVYILSIEAAARANANPATLDLIVRNLDAAVADAAGVAPEDPRVKRLEDFLNHVINHGKAAPPAKTDAGVST